MGISRKVDPVVRDVLQQQRIEADELLGLRTTHRRIPRPGKGKVYLYDRSDNSKSRRA